jgi:hypothetical protein
MTRGTSRIGIAALPLALVLMSSGVAAQGGLPATLGASTPEFQDDLAETGRWGLPDAHGSTTDSDGAIEMTFDTEGWMWGWRDLGAAHHPVLRVEGSVAIDGDDVSGGWMCGASDTLFAFGVVDAAGDWRIGHIIDSQVTVDLEGDGPDGLASGVVSVECGQENVDSTRVLLRIDGVSVGSANVGPLGPFDRVAIVGSSDDGTGSLRFDDIAAWTGTMYAPTDEPPSTPGPAPTTPVVDGVLGADTLAFEDDFSTPDQWGVGTAPEGFVSYDAEQLAITIINDGSSRWSWRSVDAPAAVMRIEGAVGIAGEGSAGWMCGDSATADPSFLFGVTGSTGGWIVGSVAGGDFTVIEEGELAGGPPEPRVPRHVVLECGDTAGDASRLVLWVDGEQVADVTADGQRGPFTKVTAMAASQGADPFNARFDDVRVWTGEGPAPAAE